MDGDQTQKTTFLLLGFGVFGANRGPRPSVDGLVSVDGLGMAGHPRMAWPSPKLPG